jgi:hypothetical protein
MATQPGPEIARPSVVANTSAPVSPQMEREYAPARSREREEAERDETVISGPSFLGLNQPSRRHTEKNDGDGPDSRDQYSGNLNYLLEDEEEPRRGWGKLFAVVVALALLGGFGYLRWKQGGFDWLRTDKDTSAAQSSDGKPADGGNAPGSTVAPGSAPSDATAANPGAAASGNDGNTTPPASAPSPAGTTDSTAQPANSAPVGAAPANSAPAPDASATTPNSASTDQTTPSATKGASNSSAPAKNNTDDSEDSPAPAKPRAARAWPARPPKPTPVKPTPVTASDPTIDASRYIYGRGPAQDCDRGLQLLKPAAARSDVKAMTMLGSLYSSGTCAPRDLPTSYRWYALALRHEPENSTLQGDLQSIWSKMTQPERQLAIKLSQ